MASVERAAAARRSRLALDVQSCVFVFVLPTQATTGAGTTPLRVRT